MEKMRPLKMRGGGIRRIADLQAASVYRGIYPLIRKMSRGKKGVVLDAGWNKCRKYWAGMQEIAAGLFWV